MLKISQLKQKRIKWFEKYIKFKNLWSIQRIFSYMKVEEERQFVQKFGSQLVPSNFQLNARNFVISRYLRVT